MAATSASATRNHCDVFVIGGGPAGASVATELGSRGLDVALAGKERHPRSPLGESLLPFTLGLLARLGVLDQVAVDRRMA